MATGFDWAGKRALVAAMLLTGISAPALAQAQGAGPAETLPVTQDDAAQDDVPEDEVITVTGSRAASAGFEAASPTTVISAELLTTQNVTTVSDALQQFPAFKGSLNPAQNGARPSNPGAASADLRGLGQQRTLVLVNGNRVTPQAPAVSVTGPASPDLNQVPVVMIDRVEVVTGGASAQWGSDAVAGVVNLILKDSYDGLSITVQGGQSAQDDFHNIRISAIGGFSFADGRGQFLAAVDYFDQDMSGDIYSRDWGAMEYQLVANSGFATNGQAANLVLPGVRQFTFPGGLITGPASFSLANRVILPNGTTRPFDRGLYAAGNFMVGGEGVSTAAGAPMIPSIRRANPYARASFEITDNITVYGEAAYSWVTTYTLGFMPRDTAVTIRSDNAFLPAEIATALGALTSFTISNVYNQIGTSPTTISNSAPRFVGGFEGSFGSSWKWNAHVSRGINRFRGVFDNDRIRTNFAFAVDAVRSGGQIVCRATLPGAAFNAAAAGCVPYNIFGDGNASTSSIDYVTENHVITSRYAQTDAAFDVQGQPFSLWAGPASVAFGVEYRKETQIVVSNAVAQVQQHDRGNAASFSGQFDVVEGYLETIMPLARDLSFARSIDLNAAVRVADYSSVGGQVTWKIGATWEPFDLLRLRVTRSRDIRAPAIAEMFSPGTSLPTTLAVRGVTGTFRSNSMIGNPNLKAEKADTLTFGAVIEPGGGFRASFDYYDIKIANAITSFPNANIVSLCNLGQQAFCDYFTFSSTGVPLSLNAPIVNAALFQTIGYDLALAYRTSAPSLFDDPASFSLSLTGTYVAHSYVDAGLSSGSIDRAGENSSANVGALPRVRANFSATYATGPIELTPQIVFISKGKINNTYDLTPATTVNDNRVPAITYLNLYGRFHVTESATIYAGINNVFDKDPPVVPQPTVFQPTNGQYYDIVGRAFQIGATVKF